MMKRTFLLVIMSVFAAECIGQIANIENKRKAEREEGFSGNLALNFSYVKNIEQILQFGGNVRGYYFSGMHSFMLLGESNIVQTESQDLVNNNFEHFRYNYALDTNRIFIIEAFEQVQQNRVQNIDLRALLGTGMRFNLASTDSLSFNLGVSGMYEYEISTESTAIERNIRGSSYISTDWQASENFGLNLIVYYQPVFNDFMDYRVSGEFGIRLKVTDKLQFTTELNLIYDNRPLPGIPNNIINFTNGLAYTF